MFRSLSLFALSFGLLLLPGSTVRGISITLLNEPSKKLGTRLQFLKGLRSKIVDMGKNPLLSSEKPELDKVMNKINLILKMAKEKGENHDDLEAKVADVQHDINSLKQDLVRKAFEINKDLQASLKKHKGGRDSVSQKREDLFSLLLDHQDDSMEKQIGIVEKFQKENSDSDAIVKGFLEKVRSQSDEPDNLAMRWGLYLDTESIETPEEKDRVRLGELAKSARLSENQAGVLLPILQKVEAQKNAKQEKLKQVQKKLDAIQVTERLVKKERGVLAKETQVLGEATDAIREGKIQKLNDAMTSLKALASSL